MKINPATLALASWALVLIDDWERFGGCAPFTLDQDQHLIKQLAEELVRINDLPEPAPQPDHSFAGRRKQALLEYNRAANRCIQDVEKALVEVRNLLSDNGDDAAVDSLRLPVDDLEGHEAPDNGRDQ